ncbi:MAG: 1,4-dihydroxy-2-naphthoate polyprenyltransferase [Bacteroidota bacterium]
MANTTVKSWISAFRLRTLPLALASIGMGSFLAASVDHFKGGVFALCALTTIFLQILSNLANDYGDTVNGADSAERQGPSRAVQSGAISLSAMKKAIALFIVLSLVSGVGLLYLSLGFNWETFLFFFGLGILSILAAIAYTAGSKPYGYVGLGDISVLIFFGVVGVLGTFYLHTGSFDSWYTLPALSCGFFSIAVLNVNNIRDIESDKKAGKLSIPVRIGRSNAVKYHWFLLLAGIGCAVAFSITKFNSPWQFLFLITVPLLFRNGFAIATNKEAGKLDPYLKQMALTTLLFVITFGVGLLLA